MKTKASISRACEPLINVRRYADPSGPAPVEVAATTIRQARRLAPYVELEE